MVGGVARFLAPDTVGGARAALGLARCCGFAACMRGRALAAADGRDQVIGSSPPRDRITDASSVHNPSPSPPRPPRAHVDVAVSVPMSLSTLPVPRVSSSRSFVPRSPGCRSRLVPESPTGPDGKPTASDRWPGIRGGGGWTCGCRAWWSDGAPVASSVVAGLAAAGWRFSGRAGGGQPGVGGPRQTATAVPCRRPWWVAQACGAGGRSRHDRRPRAGGDAPRRRVSLARGGSSR